MFGGHGFYVDDIFLAVAGDDRLYLKVDDQTRPKFEAAGCEPFRFEGKEGYKVVLGFWTVPEEALESPMLMQPWARLAMEAALRARNAKKPKAPRKSSISPASAPARTRTAAAKKTKTPARKR